MVENNGLYSISVVERDTGIGRDTLRVWERRYRFPEPLRNDKGERVYSEQQLRHLQRIKRLMDQGLRPGKLLALDENALDQLEAGLHIPLPEPAGGIAGDVLEAVRAADVERVENLLRQQYAAQGMQDFILKTLVPMLKLIGDSWAGGSLYIYQEHFLTQQLIRFLNAEIDSMQKTALQPRVILATLPGEQHTLGLLMMAGLLSAQGATVINLGGEVPMDQLVLATEQFRGDIVAMTFSGAYHYNSIRSHLIELRDSIADDVDIWVGGEGVRRLRKLPPGVSKFTSLEKLPLRVVETQ